MKTRQEALASPRIHQDETCRRRTWGKGSIRAYRPQVTEDECPEASVGLLTDFATR